MRLADFIAILIFGVAIVAVLNLYQATPASAFGPAPTPRPLFTPSIPPIPAPPLTTYPRFPSRNLNALIAEVMFYRDRGAFQHTWFDVFLAELKRQADAGYEPAKLAMAYLQAEIKAKNNALYRQLLKQGKLSSPKIGDLMKRSTTLDKAIFLLCASDADKEVTYALTEELAGVKLGISETTAIEDVFLRAGTSYDSDLRYAAVSIALKSDDPDLAPYLIQSFQMKNPRYYQRILDWLRTYGRKPHIAALRAFTPGNPNVDLAKWQEKVEQIATQMETRP
jgi:hypothetical protein